MPLLRAALQLSTLCAVKNFLILSSARKYRLAEKLTGDCRAKRGLSQFQSDTVLILVVPWVRVILRIILFKLGLLTVA